MIVGNQSLMFSFVHIELAVLFKWSRTGFNPTCPTEKTEEATNCPNNKHNNNNIHFWRFICLCVLRLNIITTAKLLYKSNMVHKKTEIFWFNWKTNQNMPCWTAKKSSTNEPQRIFFRVCVSSEEHFFSASSHLPINVYTIWTLLV